MTSNLIKKLFDYIKLFFSKNLYAVGCVTALQSKVTLLSNYVLDSPTLFKSLTLNTVKKLVKTTQGVVKQMLEMEVEFLKIGNYTPI